MCSMFPVDADAGGDTNKHPSVHHMKKLEELPLSLCRLNKKVWQIYLLGLVLVFPSIIMYAIVVQYDMEIIEYQRLTNIEFY